MFYITESDDVFGYKDTFHQLGNSHEQWLVHNICSLRRAMRFSYEEKADKKERYRRREFDLNKYSIESIGKLMLEKLCET